MAAEGKVDVATPSKPSVSNTNRRNRGGRGRGKGGGGGGALNGGPPDARATSHPPAEGVASSSTQVQADPSRVDTDHASTAAVAQVSSKAGGPSVHDTGAHEGATTNGSVTTVKVNSAATKRPRGRGRGGAGRSTNAQQSLDKKGPASPKAQSQGGKVGDQLDGINQGQDDSKLPNIGDLALHTKPSPASGKSKMSLLQVQQEQEAEKILGSKEVGLPTDPQNRPVLHEAPLADSQRFSDRSRAPQPTRENVRTDTFVRPSAPAYRKIYDPNRHTGLPHPGRDAHLALPDQARFIEKMAMFHISNVEITEEELIEKENMRTDIQEICRHAITHYALQTNPNFNPKSVTLKCFGSLRAGFATRASDMDLALVSPETEADPNFDDSMVPRLLEHVLLIQNFGARLLTRTRVPILKLCSTPTPALMENLITERLKWEEQQRLEQQKQTEQAAEDAQHDTSKGIPSGKVSQDRNEDTNGVNIDTSTERGEGEDSEPKGLRNRTNAELLRLFTLAFQEGWYGPQDREIIARFAECYEQTQGDSDNAALANARKELIKLQDVLSRYREPVDNRLDFPKNGVGIQCDINFSNALAIHNTSLLRCYNLCDPRIRQMILFVKAWAKCRDINTPYKGTLSSYGYVLMVLHYVVNVARPPLAPNLQLQLGPARGGSPETPRECNGHNIQFWRHEGQIEWSARHGLITYSQESLGSLLRGFFQYFAEQGSPGFVPNGGFGWTRDVLSLRTEGGILPKEEKGWTGARTDTIEASGTGEKPVEVRQRYLFAIEDPFEIDHNVARPVAHNGICAIRDEFRRANRIIKCGGVLDGESHDLFAEHKHHELDREVRHFGHNPSNTPRPKPKFSGSKSAREATVAPSESPRQSTQPERTSHVA